MRMDKICPICGKTFEGSWNSKYCSDKCRKDMMKAYGKRWRERHKKEGKIKEGLTRISKDMVKAPPECKGQVTCLTCTRERCRHG